jgi:ribonuclease Z
MKVTFLGTNGWYSSPTGDTVCILIDAKEDYIILDAGNGFYKLDQYITEDKPISLFISHFHLDHVSGLHTLSKFDFKQGIDVYVGKGRANDFRQLIRPPYTVGYLKNADNIVDLKTPIRLHELDNLQTSKVKVSFFQQHHAYIDHGIRIEGEGKTIAYTGDCGYSPAAKKLAQHADILICECSNKKTELPDVWGHFDPIQAALLAKESQVKRLILTHFGANLYTTIAERIHAEKHAQAIFKNTKSATDNFQLEL